MLKVARSLVVACALIPSAASAEVNEVVLAQQFGAAFTPLMFMEKFKLVEKHAVKQGLPEPKASWVKVAGPSVMNEGIISGSIQFASTGSPALALIWDRTKGGVKGLAMICQYTLFFDTRNPAVKSVLDFGENDRVAMASVKVSTQAILMQMEVERLLGVGKHDAQDHLTVSLSNPEGMASLLNERSPVTAAVIPSPFHDVAMKSGKVRTVHEGNTAVFLVASDRFRSANPKTTKAVFDALSEAIDMVNADKPRAVAVYKEMSGDRTSAEELTGMMFNPKFTFTMTPRDVTAIGQFMHRIGTLKTPVTSWKDLFFPEVHGLPGS
ncbi:MAG: ABC transporter substrate-binding protein [Casimicrobiaceae bacterium]